MTNAYLIRRTADLLVHAYVQIAIVVPLLGVLIEDLKEWMETGAWVLVQLAIVPSHVPAQIMALGGTGVTLDMFLTLVLVAHHIVAMGTAIMVVHLESTGYIKFVFYLFAGISLAV